MFKRGHSILPLTHYHNLSYFIFKDFIFKLICEYIVWKKNVRCMLMLNKSTCDKIFKNKWLTSQIKIKIMISIAFWFINALLIFLNWFTFIEICYLNRHFVWILSISVLFYFRIHYMYLTFLLCQHIKFIFYILMIKILFIMYSYLSRTLTTNIWWQDNRWHT